MWAIKDTKENKLVANGNSEQNRFVVYLSERTAKSAAGMYNTKWRWDRQQRKAIQELGRYVVVEVQVMEVTV